MRWGGTTSRGTETAAPFPRQKSPEAVRQLLAEWPTRLTEPCQRRTPDAPIKVLAQAERRIGVLPRIRRRMMAHDVQPLSTVTYTSDNFYRYGAVEPTTGESCVLELP